MKRITILSALLFLLFAQLSFAKNIPDGITLTKEGNSYKVNFNLPSYDFKTVYTGGEEYLNLTIPDYGITNEIGLPCLPQASFNLFISYDEQMPVIDNIMLSKETQLLSKKIYPTQAAVGKE